MKKYNRDLAKAPKKLCDDEYKKSMYSNLYDDDGKIRPRWNTFRENGKRAIREYLLEISNKSCVYCGKKIKDSNMDVEHYLPSSAFPYLSYCIDNLLPSCKECNQNYKGGFVPKEIKNKKIIEVCASDFTKYDAIYNKEKILNELCGNSRIIDPTFDDIEKHLNFNPEFFMYEEKSEIGKNTREMFFDRAEFIDDLEEMSEVVRVAVKKYDDSYSIVENYIKLTGYEFYYNKFYEYWQNEKMNNRI